MRSSRVYRMRFDAPRPPVRLKSVLPSMLPVELPPTYTPFPLPVYDGTFGFGPLRIESIPDVEDAKKKHWADQGGVLMQSLGEDTEVVMTRGEEVVTMLELSEEASSRSGVWDRVTRQRSDFLQQRHDDEEGGRRREPVASSRFIHKIKEHRRSIPVQLLEEGKMEQELAISSPTPQEMDGPPFATNEVPIRTSTTMQHPSTPLLHLSSQNFSSGASPSFFQQDPSNRYEKDRSTHRQIDISVCRKSFGERLDCYKSASSVRQALGDVAHIAALSDLVEYVPLMSNFELQATMDLVSLRFHPTYGLNFFRKHLMQRGLQNSVIAPNGTLIHVYLLFVAAVEDQFLEEGNTSHKSSAATTGSTRGTLPLISSALQMFAAMRLLDPDAWFSMRPDIEKSGITSSISYISNSNYVRRPDAGWALFFQVLLLLEGDEVPCIVPHTYDDNIVDSSAKYAIEKAKMGEEFLLLCPGSQPEVLVELLASLILLGEYTPSMRLSTRITSTILSTFQIQLQELEKKENGTRNAATLQGVKERMWVTCALGHIFDPSIAAMSLRIPSSNVVTDVVAWIAKQDHQDVDDEKNEFLKVVGHQNWIEMLEALVLERKGNKGCLGADGIAALCMMSRIPPTQHSLQSRRLMETFTAIFSSSHLDDTSGRIAMNNTKEETTLNNASRSSRREEGSTTISSEMIGEGGMTLEVCLYLIVNSVRWHKSLLRDIITAVELHQNQTTTTIKRRREEKGCLLIPLESSSMFELDNEIQFPLPQESGGDTKASNKKEIRRPPVPIVTVVRNEYARVLLGVRSFLQRNSTQSEEARALMRHLAGILNLDYELLQSIPAFSTTTSKMVEQGQKRWNEKVFTSDKSSAINHSVSVASLCVEKSFLRVREADPSRIDSLSTFYVLHSSFMDYGCSMLIRVLRSLSDGASALLVPFSSLLGLGDMISSSQCLYQNKMRAGHSAQRAMNILVDELQKKRRNVFLISPLEELNMVTAKGIMFDEDACLWWLEKYLHFYFPKVKPTVLLNKLREVNNHALVAAGGNIACGEYSRVRLRLERNMPNLHRGQHGPVLSSDSKDMCRSVIKAAPCVLDRAKRCYDSPNPRRRLLRFRKDRGIFEKVPSHARNYTPGKVDGIVLKGLGSYSPDHPQNHNHL